MGPCRFSMVVPAVVSLRVRPRWRTYSLLPGRAVLIALAALAPTCLANAAAVQDFSGVWEEATLGAPTEPSATPQAIFAGPDEQPPPGGEPQLREPYATEYRLLGEKKRVAAREGRPIADTRSRCLPLGMPAMMVPIFPIEIIQTPHKIVIVAEEYSQVRHIYLNEAMPPREELTPSYNGHSVGRWHGNTLVITTTGIREDSRFWDFPHSARMIVTERWTRARGGLLKNSITMTDPTVLAKPYTFSVVYRRRPGAKIMEYLCDNNRYRVDGNGGAVLDTTPR